jgi:deoxycytidylate deaminase
LIFDLKTKGMADDARSCTGRQRLFFQQAARAAQQSSMTHKHGCVIVFPKGDTVSGWNHHDIHLTESFSIHAEIDALYKASKAGKLHDTHMYVVRIGVDANTLKLSRPCSACRQKIESVGIRKIFYSTDGFSW